MGAGEVGVRVAVAADRVECVRLVTLGREGVDRTGGKDDESGRRASAGSGVGSERLQTGIEPTSLWIKPSGSPPSRPESAGGTPRSPPADHVSSPRSPLHTPLSLDMARRSGMETTRYDVSAGQPS